jgi:alpha-maltose-1-phosphate synthase
MMHPLGTPFATNAAKAFSERDKLLLLATSLYVSNNFLDATRRKVGNNKLVKELSRRAWIPEEVQQNCLTFPLLELLRILSMKTGLDKLLGLSRQKLADAVYLNVDSKLSKILHRYKDANSIYLYEDGAAKSFVAAKKQGLKCYYDLPIAFHKTSQFIHHEEAELFPELKSSLLATNEPNWKKERKDTEIVLADKIIVPSHFVRKSLLANGIASEKINVVPFGVPEYFNRREKPPKKFQVLFVGRIGPRKGVHYLLEAWSQLNLNDAKLLLVGINEFPKTYINKFLKKDQIEIMPSVPHKTLEKFYHESSLLVLPSLVEGLALVLLEAMKCGLPVIASRNSGAEDIVTNREDGFLTNIRSVEDLKSSIEWGYKNQDNLFQMGLKYAEKSEKYSWQHYRDTLNQIVE